MHNMFLICDYFDSDFRMQILRGTTIYFQVVVKSLFWSVSKQENTF
jgi:hypothetical protein